MSTDRLRLPRPGQPVRRHGPRPRRVLARGRRRLRGRRRRASASPSAASPGRAPRRSSTGPRTASRPSSPPRSPTSRPSASAGTQLEVDIPEPAFAAGHSMGQYTALVAAGALDLADAVRLVRTRGQLMQASGAGREGRMAAIIGLDDARLPELVAQASASTASSASPTATRRARSWSAASAPRSRRRWPSRRASARGAPSSSRSPSPPTRRSWPRPPTGMREVLAGITFRDPQPAAPRQRGRDASSPPPTAAAPSSSTT